MLERLKQDRLNRREMLLKRDGCVKSKERPVEESLVIILSHIQVTDSCWLWGGPRDPDRYGVTYITGRQWRAHRFIFMLVNGSINGACVLHRCDNPPCVRPDHLFSGSFSDNTKDAFAKGRMVAPRTHALLTDQQVIEIRKRYQFRHPEHNCAVIASELGVGVTVVRDAAIGKTYKHVTQTKGKL